MCAVRAGMVMVRDSVCMTLRTVRVCRMCGGTRTRGSALRHRPPRPGGSSKRFGVLVLWDFNSCEKINASPIIDTARRPGHRGAPRTALHAAGA